MLSQILQWVAQHGAATLELNAHLSRRAWEVSETGGQPLSWHHYQHGVNMLPALLPNLQHLRLCCEKGFMVAERDLFSLQILTGLQTLCLELASNGQWDLATLSPLQHLTALNQLEMVVHGLGPRPLLIAPELSRLTLLTSLSLDQGWSAQGCVYDSHHAENVISNLTGLQRLSLSCVVNRIPDMFSKLQNLCTLAIGGDGDSWPGFSAQPSIKTCSTLTSLRLQNFTAMAGTGWLDAWSALAGLPSLSNVELKGVDLHVASNEWVFGSSLTSLKIMSGNVKNFPEALLSLTTLRDLSLCQSNLKDLPQFPGGRYLEHLTSLDLCEAQLPAFPQALSRATKLEKLIAFSNDCWLDDVNRLRNILPQHCVVDIRPFGSDDE